VSLLIEHVAYSYGRRLPTVLDDARLAVDSGESVAVVGPSGSGKSTLLAVAGLLIGPTAGRIEINGIPVHTGRERARLRASSIGWVFQSSNVIPTRTVGDNVALPMVARGFKRRHWQSAVSLALDAVGLSGYGSRLAKNISGGELQRVTIARAIVARPALIVADEPTGNLDADTSADIVNYLIDATRTHGLSLLFATHDPQVAAACDRIDAIRDGSIQKGVAHA